MNFSWEEIKEGVLAEFETEITPQKVNQFIQLTGDVNPLHQDPAFAKNKGFKAPLVQGMLLASFFSTLVGTYLAAGHCLYLSQTCQFKKPVFLGEKIRVRGEIKRKVESVKLLYIETTIFNQDNEPVLTGEAVVKYL